MDERATLDRILGLLEAVAEKVARLEADWEAYRSILPEPGSVKEKMVRRAVAARALRGWE